MIELLVWRLRTQVEAHEALLPLRHDRVGHDAGTMPAVFCLNGAKVSGDLKDYQEIVEHYVSHTWQSVLPCQHTLVAHVHLPDDGRFSTLVQPVREKLASCS